MTNKEFLVEFGNIDPELIEAAAPAPKVRKKSNILVKWTALAACFALIISAMIVLPMFREDDTSLPDNNGRYKDFTIQAGEYGIVWQWKYKTVYEKYSSIDVGGTEFIGRNRELSASYVGKKLGSYKATGYDDTSDEVHHEYFDAYEIKNVATSRLIAVKMEERYYVFISKNYDPPATLGEVWEAYSLSQYIKLDRFSIEKEGKDRSYRLLSDDEYILSVLKESKAAKASDPIGWHENKGNFVSFTVTSEALGVYKNVMYITESGYLWTNIFNGEYLYFIGKDAAQRIISYAKENSAKAEFEPYNKTVAGKVVEINDSYILIDDSILCKDKKDGITYKILIDDIKISRYIECDIVKVGSVVIVAYEGDIDSKSGNTISQAIDISEGFISDGEVLIPE